MTEMLTVGLAMTEWANAERGVVPVATCSYMLGVKDIVSVANYWKRQLSMDDVVAGLRDGILDNWHVNEAQKFGLLLAAYVGQTESFQRGQAIGHDGLWIRMLNNAKTKACLMRPSVSTYAEQIRTWIDKVDADPNQLDMWERQNLLASIKDPDVTGMPQLSAQPDLLFGLQFGVSARVTPRNQDDAKSGAGVTGGFGAGKTHVFEKDWFKRVDLSRRH